MPLATVFEISLSNFRNQSASKIYTCFQQSFYLDKRYLEGSFKITLASGQCFWISLSNFGQQSKSKLYTFSQQSLLVLLMFKNLWLLLGHLFYYLPQVQEKNHFEMCIWLRFGKMDLLAKCHYWKTSNLIDALKWHRFLEILQVPSRHKHQSESGLTRFKMYLCVFLSLMLQYLQVYKQCKLRRTCFLYANKSSGGYR